MQASTLLIIKRNETFINLYRQSIVNHNFVKLLIDDTSKYV